MFYLIAQRDSNWYISRKKYKRSKKFSLFKDPLSLDYDDYLFDMGFYTIQELIEFVENEWGLSEEEKQIFLKFDEDIRQERLILKDGLWDYE